MGWQDTERGQTGMATVIKGFEQGMVRDSAMFYGMSARVFTERDQKGKEGRRRMFDEFINRSHEFGRTRRGLVGMKKMFDGQRIRERRN